MKKFLYGLFFILLSRTSLANNTHAEDLTDLSIEELMSVEMISASRLGQKASQAPSSVSVVTASDIRTFGWRTLADALNAMRGLFTSNDRSYSYVGVRGFNQNDFNSRVLLMIDGQRMNENIYDGGYIAQEFMLDIDLIDRIEFIPGSGSTIYGANAFLGLVNVITKKGHALGGTQAAAEIGSFDAYKGRASYGKTLANGTDLLFSASHFGSAGAANLYFPKFDTPETNNGIAHNLDGEAADRLFGKIQYKEYTLSGGYVSRTKQVPTAAFGQVFNTRPSYVNDQQFFANLKYQKQITPKTDLLLKSFYQQYDYHADNLFDVGVLTLNHDQSNGQWLGGEAQLTSTAFRRQRWIAGIEYQYDLSQYEKNYDVNPYVVNLSSLRRGHRMEVYAQDDIQLAEDWVLSAGARFDYHHLIKNVQLNPRLGLIWNATADTTYKLLYSSTFRAPNISELDNNTYYFGVNTQLREELIKSYEGIVEWHPANNTKVIGSLFYNDVTHVLTFDPSGETGLFGNFGCYHVYGAEWEAEKRWDNGRLMRGSYTYSLMAHENKPGYRVLGSPEHVFKLHYAEPLFNNYAKIGVENIFIGDRKVEHGMFADAYDLINLNLSSDKLAKGLDLSIGVYNLLDNRYQSVSGPMDIVLMNGREFRVKAVLGF